ncbi:MAG: hypothetical protein ACE14M_06460 [Terriglobales bacterium]
MMSRTIPCALIVVLTCSVGAWIQQTVFNVPNADVLDRGNYADPE